MSALQALWEPAAPAQRKTKGLLKKIEMDRVLQDRERSPRRRCGLKALLKSWAMGEISTVAMWRLCHSICKQDGTDAGVGMARLAELAECERSSSEQNCARQLRQLLAATSLTNMICLLYTSDAADE